MELMLADLGKENGRYLRKDIDGGILTEKYEIDRYKLEQYASVVDNLMLGNYNEFGDYVVETDLLDELLKCKKVITDNYENILFVESVNSVNAFGNLNFAIKVVDCEQAGYKTAVLELLEPIYKCKGYIENTQATIIKKINLPFNDAFKSEVYKEFNIISIEGLGAERELENKDEFQKLIDRKIKLLYVKKHIEAQDDFMMCYKKNVDELKKTDEGKKVLENYKKEEKIAENYLKLDKNDYKSKNELLTKNIESVFKAIPMPIINNLVELHKKTVNKIQKVMVNVKKQQEEKAKPKKIVIVKNTAKEKDRLRSLDDVLGR